MKTYKQYLVCACVETDAGVVRIHEELGEESFPDGVTLDEVAQSIDGNPSDPIWSVYGYANDQGSECIADCGSLPAALDTVARITGRTMPAPMAGRLVYRVTPLDPVELAVCGAFLMRGASASAFDLAGFYPNGGLVGFISDLCSFAPMVENKAADLTEAGEGLPGVWGYEVVEPFGEWLAAEILNNGIPDAAKAEKALAGIVSVFMREG